MPPAIASQVRPVVLITVAREQPLASILDRHGYAVVQAHTGTLALDRAADFRPDVIILEADLPDMSGIDACWLLRSDPRVGRNVPILILTPNKPTPEQRVTALRAGVWDFLLHSTDPEELSLRLQTYVQAKRNIDDALAEGLVDPATGLHNRPGLARRARELGALMSRNHGALACVVFALEAAPADPRAGMVVAQTARLSDVVGALGPTEFAVLAPGTDEVGAVRLAQRVAGALGDAVGGGDLLGRGSTLRAGYDAVGNLKYTPIDPAELLARATTAVKKGKPERHYPWVRRFDVGKTWDRDSGATTRISAPGLVLDKGGTSS